MYKKMLSRNNNPTAVSTVSGSSSCFTPSHLKVMGWLTSSKNEEDLGDAFQIAKSTRKQQPGTTGRMLMTETM